jgi:hypothetical protein
VSVTLYGDSAAVKQWMAARFGGPVAGRFCSTIALIDGDRIKGAVWLENYNGASVVGHVVGDGRGWMTRGFALAVFHYVFNVLGCNKFIGWVREANTEAQRFDEWIGFTREATIADADPEGAIHIYTLTRDNCIFLKGKHHGQA